MNLQLYFQYLPSDGESEVEIVSLDQLESRIAWLRDVLVRDLWDLCGWIVVQLEGNPGFPIDLPHLFDTLPKFMGAIRDVALGGQPIIYVDLTITKLVSNLREDSLFISAYAQGGNYYVSEDDDYDETSNTMWDLRPQCVPLRAWVNRSIELVSRFLHCVEMADPMVKTHVEFWQIFALLDRILEFYSVWRDNPEEITRQMWRCSEYTLYENSYWEVKYEVTRISFYRKEGGYFFFTACLCANLQEVKSIIDAGNTVEVVKFIVDMWPVTGLFGVDPHEHLAACDLLDSFMDAVNQSVEILEAKGLLLCTNPCPFHTGLHAGGLRGDHKNFSSLLNP